ncbi:MULTISPECIES: DUF1254 domain-containing protein [Okeania]|nr:MULTISPECIES: DUF1254 domain-containing protein [Okeania]NES79547.1 DUF1254 domain-containing protein [Okeania sp. SIO1H4]NES89345.1 DUF1254 domain-containing protein [Okeania sp. SIO2B9]NET23218.1 DUF1254 domain-containing protein [Okeania sp. SIO1H5]NET77960.1 DUF1254 domain-containing protein [Okeania sp. SIO1F9]NET96773.1 DUF1254 domain-containing protein [Okeania sp. SIO1H2]
MAEWQAAHEETFGIETGEIVVYQTFPEKLGILTANATTPYIIGFFDLAKTGPVVVEMPAGEAAGFADDIWQRPIVDMGQTGPDEGLGGTYCIYGPGQKGLILKNTKKCEYRVPSTTFNVFWGFRSLNSDKT